jgi:hypothetical protein
VPIVTDMTTFRPASRGIAAASDTAWRRELRRRICHRFWLKAIGVSVFMWLFFSAYFQILRHPVHALHTMPLTALDHWIPFQPAWLAAYVSLWFYVGIAPGLMLQMRSALAYGAWAAALCAAGLACFYFWPSAVPASAPVDLVSHPAFALLQGVDAAGNACPSLHVATAMFAAFWIHRLLAQVGAPAALRLLNGLWFVAIAYSTVAIRQHVTLDVLAGALLGAAFGIASLRHGRRG